MAGQTEPINTTPSVTTGAKTSEFWVTILSQIIGVLVLSGQVTPDQAQLATDVVTQSGKLVVDAVALAYMLYTAYIYIKGRNDLKKSIVEGASGNATQAPSDNAVSTVTTTETVATQ